MNHVVVCIDGEARSGKSTVAREVARLLDVPCLETGVLYRAATLVALDSGLHCSDGEGIGRSIRDGGITLVGSSGVLVDGLDVDEEIRSPDIDRSVSEVSANPEVREVLTKLVREWAAKKPLCVVEGRDIGSVVFPDSCVKVFLTASLEVKAARDLGASAAPDEGFDRAASIRDRDAFDRSRELSPMAPAPDARVIDTTEASVDETVSQVLSMLRRRDCCAGS